MRSSPGSWRRRTALPGYAALILAGGAVLASCGHSAPTRFFTLDPLAPQGMRADAYVGPPLKVLAVHIPPELDREELVSESPEGVMQVHDFEHWEAPLGLTARQTVIQDLIARLPAGAVLGPASPGQGAATLTADIVSFQVGAGGATMQAVWSVTLPAGLGGAHLGTWRAPMAAFRTSADGVAGVATAHAFSALLAQLSDRMAADLPAAVAELTAERRQAEAAARAAASRMSARTTRTTTVTSRQPG